MNIDNALYTLNIAPDARQLTVFIDGEAIPQSRPKITTRGKNGVPLPHAIAYYKDASIYYRQQCEYCIKQAVQKSGIFFKDVALFCEVYIFLPVPASKSKKFKAAVDVGAEFPKVKPDCDNLFKNITDAAEGLAFDTDSRIVSVHIHKRYTNGAPFAVLRLTEVNEEITVLPAFIKLHRESKKSRG